jgi:AI-2 transport protein TqsA
MPLRRTGEALLVVAAFVIVIAGLRLAAPLIVPVLLAASIAAASAPIALGVKHRGAPSWAGPVVALLVDVAILGAIVMLIGISLREVQERLPYYATRFSHVAEETSGWLLRHGIVAPAERIEHFVDSGSMMSLASAAVTSILDVASEGVLVLLIALFLLVELTTFQEKLRVLWGRADDAFWRFQGAVHEVQRYLMVKTVLSVLTGALTGICLALLQIDFTVLLALAAFLLNYIPNVGSIIAAVPAIAVALLQYGPGRALGVAVGYIFIHVVVGNIVEPRVLGRTMGLSPFVVLLSMIFWGWLWGPVGALLSVPLTMVVKLVLENDGELGWVAVLLGPAPSEARRSSIAPSELLKRISNPPPPRTSS